MNRGTSRRVLNSTHLKVFDDNAKKIILRAMKLGATGKINTNGHAWIYAPNGTTMSVSRDTSAPNCLKNVRADFKRCFPEESVDPLTKESTKPMHTDTRYVAFTSPAATNGNGVATVAPKDDTMIPCPAKGCDKEFVTEGAKLRHVSDDHATCTEPGCTWGTDGKAYVARNGSALSGHRATRHPAPGTKPPWERRDPAKRHAAALKGAATRAAKKRAAVKAGTTVGEHTATVAPSKEAAPKVHDVHGHPAVVEPAYDARVDRTGDKAKLGTERPEHRAVPTTPVKSTDAAKLAEIRRLLGADPKVALLEAANAKLQAKIDELEAQLALIAEVMHLPKQQQKK